MQRRSIRVVAAVVMRGDLYLITQRRPEAVLGSLWEFPGGKVESGESDEAALIRELDERIGVQCTVGERLAERSTSYADYDLVLALYNVSLDPESTPTARRVKDVRWVSSSDFERYPFPAADQKTMDALLGITR